MRFTLRLLYSIIYESYKTRIIYKNSNRMQKILEKPKLKELRRTTMHPRIGHKTTNTAEILRVVSESGVTRIDFIVRACKKYVNGGWVSMLADAYISPVGSNERLRLIKAVNIPLSPSVHHFRNLKGMLCYTLLFPPVSRDVTAINIIEAEGPGGNWFNFYNVSMATVRTTVFEVSNSN